MLERPPIFPPEICPICGENVPQNARACQECGADERTGWNENETSLDGLDLPEWPEQTERMDYNEFIAREFGVGGWKRFWIPLTAGILLLAFVLWMFLG